MLSESGIERKRIYEICENSEGINTGDSFKDCVVADDHYFCPPEVENIICCGPISDEEMLFRTEHGSFYFSLVDGWGTHDGILYGLSVGMKHDFKRPTTPDTIEKECESDRGTYNSWGGALSWKHRGHVLDTVIAVMKQEKK